MHAAKWFCLALLPVIVGCSSTTNKSETAPAATAAAAKPVEAADLTWDQAKARKARLGDVRYELDITLTAKDETFSGVNKVRFTLKQASAQPLRIDFYEGSVQKLEVNGQPADIAAAKRKYWIELPAALLKDGENLVEIAYTSAYTRQGVGLHRFVDPETKDTFIYSKLEPYEANRVMPLFDQPDLRATLRTRATVPASWKVLTTTRESNVKKEKDTAVWSFPETPRIATYLFSLHAGPYQIWSDKFEDIPLRIYARPSMAKYVRPKQWFAWTKKGLKYYNNYFALKYPFKKYDQIFVPEAGGAMENVAAVTFTENLLARAEPTRRLQRAQASVLLHEMAHMWFGDIVTMAWWNDLWLNESFATYMAALASVTTTEFKETWQDFYIGEKEWAYWEDGLVTTHPIEAPVTSIKEAFANFDGITYGKGASVVKQLRHYIGAKAFDDGIRDYMKAHAYKNTELKDFIAALQTHTQKDLSAWADLWLRQSGADKLQAQWTCSAGVLTNIKLVTTPVEGARFRPQKVDVSLYYESSKVKPVTIEADLSNSIVTLNGNWPCPNFVYPNANDHGYAKVSLDPVSLEYAKNTLSKFDSALLRNQLWGTLWDMVRAGEMPLKDYITAVQTHFTKENDQMVLEAITSTIAANENRSILYYWPPASGAAGAKREAFIAGMEKEYLARLKKAKPASDPQKFWFDEYNRLARTPSGLAQVRRWLAGEEKVPGLPLDLDRRWRMTLQLARFQTADAGPFVEALKKEDTSDRGKRNTMSVEAIQPDPATKQKWMTTLQKLPKPDLSVAEAASVANWLFPIEQRDLSRPFDDSMMAYLRANGKSENEIYVRLMAGRLSPLSCDGTRAARFRKFIASTSFNMSIAKAVKIGLQEDERCQLVRAKSQLQ